MLRFYKLPYYDGQFSWEISPIRGCLLKSEHLLSSKHTKPKKIIDALYLINNPYEVNWSAFPNQVELNWQTHNKIEQYNRQLFNLGNRKFFQSILYSTVGKKYFETTHDAFTYISKLKEHEYGSENCFQRSLLAAKASKSFKERGIIFIGAELSTYNMHAWIIEHTCQPDFEDRVWINYRPLLAITF